MTDMNEERIVEDTLEGNSQGTVKIASDVVATIAGLAAADVSGVAGMSGGFSGGIAELLGRKNLTKGVKVEINEQDALLDIMIIVEYGYNIADVARNVQQVVKKAVEGMTGLNCAAINIHVQGVSFPQKDEQPAEE